MRQCLCFVIYKYQLSLNCLSPLQLLLRLWVPGKEKEKEEEEEQKTAARETNGVQMSIPAVASC